ncbi:NAD(P)/FAD-dependent oxidoreductase [Leucobacter sp. HY1908]
MTHSRAIVVGAGAWGLPAALELQDRGWHVTLIERFAPGSPYASSGGSSRLWRLADTQAWRARGMIATRTAMERLGERLGASIHSTTGLVWRDDESLPAVAAALASIGQPVERLAPAQVGDAFPGLRPDGRPALWVEQAGVVHADRLLAGALAAFIAAGGDYRPATRVTGIDPDHAAGTAPRAARVQIAGGEVLEAEQVLVAAGPGTRELLPGLGLELPLTPYIEQVVHLGSPAAQPPEWPAPALPGLVDCPIGDAPGIYAMPDAERGYKVGLDQPLRPLAGGTLGEDLDRAAVPERTEIIRARVARDLTAIEPYVLATQVCTWTDSGDGDFVVGRVHSNVVLACGDSGEGFKYAAFMGQYLTDLVEGGAGDPEFQRHWNPARFRGVTTRTGYSAIGRH